jgi:hypothetical protein
MSGGAALHRHGPNAALMSAQAQIKDRLAELRIEHLGQPLQNGRAIVAGRELTRHIVAHDWPAKLYSPIIRRMRSRVSSGLRSGCSASPPAAPEVAPAADRLDLVHLVGFGRGREAENLPRLLRENMADEVVLVQPLHDDDDRANFRTLRGARVLGNGGPLCVALPLALTLRQPMAGSR